MNSIFASKTVSALSHCGLPQARRQSGVGRPVVVAIVVLLATVAAWWAWSSRNSVGGGGVAGDPARAASVSASGARRSNGGGGGGGRFGAISRTQPISVATVRKQDVRVSVNAIGNITAANTAIVRAKVSGELKALFFKEGQTVKAGALLAEIDPRAYQIALAQAQGTLTRDQAQLANAKIDLARYRDLQAKDAAPKQQMDTQQALVAQLEGTVMSDQAQVDNAKLQLSYTRVVAPIAGLIGLKQVDIGNNVQPSDVNGLLSIAQIRPVNVVFSVPDVQLPLILRQLKGNKGLPVQAWDRDKKTKLADGKLASTDNAIDSATGTIKLKAQFANAKDELFPNQFVNVSLQVDNIEGTLAVPSAAVLRGAQGTYVYLVNTDSTVTVRRVTVGANDGDWVSLQGELKVGDQVVIDGADRLREGAQVEVIASNAGGGKRPAATSAGDDAARKGPIAPPRPVASATANPTTAAEDPPWMSRLPPGVADKVRAMSPDERAAWIQKRREERTKAAGNN